METIEIKRLANLNSKRCLAFRSSSSSILFKKKGRSILSGRRIASFGRGGLAVVPANAQKGDFLFVLSNPNANNMDEETFLFHPIDISEEDGGRRLGHIEDQIQLSYPELLIGSTAEHCSLVGASLIPYSPRSLFQRSQSIVLH